MLSMRVQKMSVKVYERSGHWGMSDLIRKNSKISIFFDKKGRKKIWQKSITARRSTERCSIDYFKNISISKPIVETGLKTIAFAL